MALTLIEMAKGLKDKVMQGLLLDFARQSRVMEMVSFDDTDSFVNKQWVVRSVTDAVNRSIGESYAETKDSFVPVVDGISLVGGQVDIDRALLLPTNRELDPYAENLRLQAQRFRYKFMSDFVDGNPASDPEQMKGIKERVEDVAGDQVIAAGGLDLTASSANRQQFLDLLQQAMFEVAEGMPDLILSSKQGLWQLQRVARREGLLDTTRDSFDREVQTFMGVRMDWAGTQGDQTTQVITNTETAAGARTGGTNTSFYFIRFGASYVQGIQMHEPRKIFDDIIDDGVTRRAVFEWPVGLTTFHQKSIVRLRGITPID